MTPAAAPADIHADAHAATRAITRLSVGVAVVLIALKAFALGASGSVSILASLADSALDLVASLGVFLAVRWAAAPADEDHRYGHGKGEALAALVQAGLVFATALFIGWEAVQRIFDPRPVTSGYWGVLIILISIALTGWLVWMQGRAMRQSGSLAVAADRAHYAGDLAANGVVLIGVISGTFLAAPGLDAAAGLVVSVWLFWGALGILKAAADHLVDKAVPDADRVAITTAVLSDPRISGVHQLRTRMAGSVMMIQMHVDLEPSLTLDAAHAIVVEAENRLLAAFPRADILIHPDPRGRAEPHAPSGAETVQDS
ncbi:MAG: cation diffusion facilitator family transporter [Alphaproteobacteria bacterium]|jgi:cation diffusion facilitator family transporter|nr:cation diffusion facilitator family transporter [Alphaproteobacteria bacterium]MBU2043006.1 cation diffusion facilitator family transporter [Alphaproteobacteria bacterium]MBU2126939.1 cation diffusion facilitator family transporter [Alphaproteobacteria bacterium]MBU2209169.1 cation diffusion facilitator family transporter [Alphaproteobacteria bacterium]MBU2292320.1 cation diffusion facilitator family transporter [Alphaproteobacteria bacterium]